MLNFLFVLLVDADKTLLQAEWILILVMDQKTSKNIEEFPTQQKFVIFDLL